MEDKKSETETKQFENSFREIGIKVSGILDSSILESLDTRTKSLLENNELTSGLFVLSQFESFPVKLDDFVVQIMRLPVYEKRGSEYPFDKIGLYEKNGLIKVTGQRDSEVLNVSQEVSQLLNFLKDAGLNRGELI